MAADKLLAEWFWIDRWMGSSAFLLPMEARGLYREMLSQAWRRGAQLPNDHDQIRRAVGATVGEWRRGWPKVKPFWRVSGGLLIPVQDDLGYSQPIPEQTSHRPHIPLRVRRDVFARHGRRCRFCGTEDRIELDHVVPFSQGGQDVATNLQPLCKPCNLAKGAN